jgi:hypothetical protein
MIAYNGFLDDDAKEAGTDFARRWSESRMRGNPQVRRDSAPRNSDDDADVADFFTFFERRLK